MNRRRKFTKPKTKSTNNSGQFKPLGGDFRSYRNDPMLTITWSTGYMVVNQLYLQKLSSAQLRKFWKTINMGDNVNIQLNTNIGGNN